MDTHYPATASQPLVVASVLICPGLHAEPILVHSVKHCKNQPCTHIAGLLQNTVEVIQPQRKKGRSNPDQACNSTTGLSCQACIQAGHSAVTGVLAVAGDAARLLQWACCAPAAVATFEMATALLAWANELCQMSSGAVQ